MNNAIVHQEVIYRSVTKADNRFLRDLYCTFRDYETANLAWPEKKLTVFLRQQFALQQKHFDKTYPKANNKIIVYQGKAIGRICSNFDHSNRTFHLIDITLLRQYRGQGIGRFLIEQLVVRAQEKASPIGLYVQNLNPAFKLYEAIGFKSLRVNDGYIYMQYQPE
jgi:ribosomal protein S18 acetylase RimI-like enzyme